MCERLTGRQDGQPKVFRDSCIANFTEFFDRFRRLNVRSNPELDALVDQARQVITGIEPQQLRAGEEGVKLAQCLTALLDAGLGHPAADSRRIDLEAISLARAAWITVVRGEHEAPERLGDER